MSLLYHICVVSISNNLIKINGLKICLLLFLLCFGIKGFCQTPSVVVSEYYNAGSETKDEWIELLVVNDSTNLVGFTLGDNNTDQDSWQTPITFTSNSLWQKLRSGTIIVIWTRRYSSSSPQFDRNTIIDSNAIDGYIELNAQATSFFSGGAFGSSTSWSGATLSLGGNGEIVQIKNGSGTHIHSLGHKPIPGSSYSSITLNRLNHNTISATGKATYISPGTNISEYLGYGSGIFSGNLLTNLDSDTTRGLPNSTNVSLANRSYWQSLRQPIYNSPTLNTIIPNISYTQLTLTWSTCTDSNPIDSTTGYIILRNTTNSFVAPTDGKTYSISDTVGTATVAGHINFSSTLAFTDIYTLNCSSIIYYKIYAFRYGTDNLNGNSYNIARGRAYNEIGTNVQSLTRALPISQNIISN